MAAAKKRPPVENGAPGQGRSTTIEGAGRRPVAL